MLLELHGIRVDLVSPADIVHYKAAGYVEVPEVASEQKPAKAGKTVKAEADPEPAEVPEVKEGEV